MKILFLSDLWQPFPGGAERLAFNLGRDLMRRGHDVVVLTGYELAQQLDGPPVIIRDDIEVFATRDRGAKIVEAYLGATQPDLVITHHLYAFQFEEELIASGVPFIQLVLNTRRIDGAVFAVHISDWVRENVPGVQPYDLTITPPVFDDVVAKSEGAFQIGFIKPIPHKGVDTVYRIAELMPDRQFLILRGEWQDMEDIRDLPNVGFMDPVVDIRDFYSQVEIMLMPSRSEDAGTVAQECALNRIPCLSSYADGLAQTNGGGIRLAWDDAIGFAAAIRGLDDPVLLKGLLDRQEANQASFNQDALLDQFAAGIKAIGDNKPLPWIEEEDDDG